MDLAKMKELSSSTCIVGVDESDEIGTLPNKSMLTLHVESIHNAVRDAGLKVSDVDGVFTAGQHSPATIAEAIGVIPRYVDGTTVGGCSFIIMAGHAMLALHHGLCDVAVISHGESGRSGVGVTPRRDTALPGQFEMPYGFGGAPTYFGLITTRHMHEYGTTLEQWAQVAVSTRKWAALNPKARNRDPLTVKDVLDSRPVVWPFNILNICLVTDAGGAVVMTRADRARDCAKKPVYVRGAGEGAEHVMLTQMRNLTHSEATRLSGQKAFAMAGVGPARLQPHHALRRLHLGAADHAGVAGLRQAGRGRALLRGRALDAGRHAPHQHQRRRPLLHPQRHVRDLPHHRVGAPAPRGVWPAPGPERVALAGERHGRHALRGGNARALEPEVASDRPIGGAAGSLRRPERGMGAVRGPHLRPSRRTKSNSATLPSAVSRTATSSAGSKRPSRRFSRLAGKVELRGEDGLARGLDLHVDVPRAARVDAGHDGLEPIAPALVGELVTAQGEARVVVLAPRVGLPRVDQRARRPAGSPWTPRGPRPRASSRPCPAPGVRRGAGRRA